jgi:hypothetical protein
VLFLSQMIHLGESNPPLIITNDAARYLEIARSAGVPYRDFEVEFPPLTLAVIDLLAGSTVAETAVRLGILSFIVHLITAWWTSIELVSVIT